MKGDGSAVVCSLCLACQEQQPSLSWPSCGLWPPSRGIWPAASVNNNIQNWKLKPVAKKQKFCSAKLGPLVQAEGAEGPGNQGRGEKRVCSYFDLLWGVGEGTVACRGQTQDNLQKHYRQMNNECPCFLIRLNS